MAEFTMVQKYDALKGRPIRDIKANDIVHIAASYAHVAAGGTLAFHALSSTTELYITGFGVSAGAAQDFVVTVDTSTILPVRLGAAGETHLITTREAPFFKADASSTISIVAVSAGSCAGWLCGVREPSFEYVETI